MPSSRRAHSGFIQHSLLAEQLKFRHSPFARGPSQSSQEGHAPLAPGGGLASRGNRNDAKARQHARSHRGTPAFGRANQVRQVNAPPGSPVASVPVWGAGGARMRVCHFARDVASFCNLAGPRSDPVPKRQSNRGRFAKTNPSGSKFILNQPPLDALSSAFTNAGAASYRFAFADLRPAAFGLVDLIAVLTWCAAALLFRRTPGCSPFVNSTPAASSARCNASIVRSFNSSPRSNLATVSIETFAAAARSRMPKPTAARAIRQWIGRIIIAQLRF
jgi:hypothetical protein